jgi:NAD(P)-dependent dehydrogenase (short-subunit alcohol dehydrogenase family)
MVAGDIAMTLAGKVAAITGVTSPLGQAIALRLAATGAAVAVTGHTPAKVENVAEALGQAKAKCIAEALDRMFKGCQATCANFLRRG